MPSAWHERGEGKMEEEEEELAHPLRLPAILSTGTVLILLIGQREKTSYDGYKIVT